MSDKFTITGTQRNLMPFSIFRVLLIEVLNFIRISQTAPMILLFFAMIILLFMSLFGLFGNSKAYIPFVPSGQTYNFDGKDILTLYGFISLVFYFIGVILKRVFKIKFIWILKKKIFAAIIATTICYTFIFLFFFIKENNSTTLLVIGLFYIITIIASFYGLTISYLISKAIDFLNRIAEKNRSL